MMQTVNGGRDFFIYTLSLPVGVDVPFGITTGYTPGAGQAQTMNANSIMIKCRTSVDMQFRKTAASAEYITIPAGGTFTFDISPTQTQNLFFLHSTAGTLVAEIMVTIE